MPLPLSHLSARKVPRTQTVTFWSLDNLEMKTRTVKGGLLLAIQPIQEEDIEVWQNLFVQKLN